VTRQDTHIFGKKHTKHVWSKKPYTKIPLVPMSIEIDYIKLKLYNICNDKHIYYCGLIK